MTCRNGDCGQPARPYAYALGHRQSVLCDACFASLSAIGMSLSPIERRDHVEPVAHERRRWMPVWRRRDLSRDLTGALR